jgi:hypothetical protein
MDLAWRMIASRESDNSSIRPPAPLFLPRLRPPLAPASLPRDPLSPLPFAVESIAGLLSSSGRNPAKPPPSQVTHVSSALMQGWTSTVCLPGSEASVDICRACPCSPLWQTCSKVSPIALSM